MIFQLGCNASFESKKRELSSLEGSVKVQSSSNIDIYQIQAIDLYKRLSGVTPNIDSPIIDKMKVYLQQGDLFSAAYLATSQSGFYNITVRDFAVKLSNIDISVSAPLNDLAATVIGSVRDDLPATQLLTENYFYRAKDVSGIPNNLESDIIRSNNHYQYLESNGFDLSEILKKEEGQKIIAENGTVTTLSDSAGLLTSRAFMSAHAQDGTNRRIIEYTFKVFMCTPIDEWANSSNPDNRIGPDVGRFPQGDYLNKCKACHSGMDSLRPATAHFDFSNGFIKYNYTYANDPNPNNPSQLNVPVPANEQNVPYKFRRSSDNFPGGFRVSNDNWINYSDNNQFGFRTQDSGSGMQELGQLVAHSEQFSRCMVQRVFETVCRRKIQAEDQFLIQNLSTQFENDLYNLKNLFVNIAIQPECIGLEI